MASGIDFRHFNGMTGEYYFPEMMGGGGALVDYDVDGDLDLYLVQGAMLGEHELSEALFPPRHPLPLTDRLYRNDSHPDFPNSGGEASLRFVDVTAAAGLVPGSGYGMGVASGDYDDDGFPDLYVTAFGSNRLLRNRGDGSFEDATAAAGVDDPRWSVPAVFFDADADGRLDLWVGNYLDFTLATHKLCRTAGGARDYCGPQAYRGVTDKLFRNRGDGTFEDVSAASGIGGRPGKALGALAADLDGDRRPDLYVANDGEPNFRWASRGDGRFEEIGLAAGCALSADGLPQASMGVDAADADGDGDLDLFMTHLTGEPNALFRSEGGGLFVERSAPSGLGPPSWPLTGFGARFFDLDNDGGLDLLIVNGAVRTIEALAQAGDPYPLHQPRQLYRNLGAGRFEEIGGDAGPGFAGSEVGRGAAFGDLDNDGDADVVVVNNNGPARLFSNQRGSANRWLGVRAVTVPGGADLAGALVTVEPAGGGALVRRLATDGSYASASDPRLVVGLGGRGGEVSIRLAPPAGGNRRWTGLGTDRYLVLPASGGAAASAAVPAPGGRPAPRRTPSASASRP